MRRILTFVVALVMLIGAGYVHGLWTHRWGVPADIQGAASRLQQIPAVIGEWTSTEQVIDESQLRQAEAAGYISRRYVKRGVPDSEVRGAIVDVMILCGPTGPMAVHPPTVCFTSVGFNQVTSLVKTVVHTGTATGANEFFETTFAKEQSGSTRRLQTFWAWTADGRWQAPDQPRLEFAHHPYLYKLYVTRETDPRELIEESRSADGADASSASSDHENDPAVEFLEEFLPAVNGSLFESK